jgi:hypothetical protein
MKALEDNDFMPNDILALSMKMHGIYLFIEHTVVKIEFFFL